MDQGREGRKPGWFWADNKILDKYAKEIGPHATLVYMVLVRHLNQDGQCWPSFQTIGKMLKVSRRTVINSIEKLAEVGLITVEPRHDEKKGQMSNLYTVMCVEDIGKGDAHEPRSASPTPVQEVHPPYAPQTPPPVQEVHPNKTYKNKTQGTSGGVAPSDRDAAAAVDQTVVNRLKKVGQSDSQARRYAPLQEWNADKLDCLDAWYATKKLDKRIESAGRLLASFLMRGEVPDDLPPPPEPVLTTEEAEQRYLERFRNTPARAHY